MLKNIILFYQQDNSLELDENNYMDTFNPEINKDICLDYVKVLNSSEFNIKKVRNYSNNNTSVSTLVR